MKNIAFLLLFLGLSFSIFGQNSFWTPQEVAEVSGFSELEGLLKLSFRDSVSGEVVKGATVSLLGEVSTTDNWGVAEFDSSLIEDIMDKDIPFSVSHTDYIPYEDKLRVRLGSAQKKFFVLSRQIKANQARFILEWGKNPKDLDAHLESDDFHISFRNKKNSQGRATLDRDAMFGYGPETITLLNIDKTKEYNFYVDNYSNKGKLKDFSVTLYINNTLYKTFYYSNNVNNQEVLIKISNGSVEVLNEGD